MRLHRFYVDQKIGEEKTIVINSTDLVHQLRKVFRMRAGDDLIVFNGTGIDYVCKIDGFGEESTISSDSVVRLLVTNSHPSIFSPSRRLFLCAALVKKDIFEWIVEKATELGVTDIIPIAADRSEKKSLNEERVRKIAIEASEQSGRGATPMVHPIMGRGEAAAFIKKEEPTAKLMAFHTEGERITPDQISNKSEPLGVFIGPEGGWSPEEMQAFHAENIPALSLGPQVLRAETAVVAALSVVVFG